MTINRWRWKLNKVVSLKKQELGVLRIPDLPIKKINFKDVDIIQNIQWQYPTCKVIKDFTEKGISTPYTNKESLKILDKELLDILNKKYLPRYVSMDLNGHRDNIIIPATLRLIKRNMPRNQMELVFKMD